MEAITDFIVASKISGLFIIPIIVSLVFALLFKTYLQMLPSKKSQTPYGTDKRH